MEDKYTMKLPEGVDREQALAEFADKMQQLNGKIQAVTETLTIFRKQATRPAGMNRQSFRAAHRKGHRKGRKRRHK